MRIQDYDTENDILYLHLGGKVHHSIEFLEGKIVFDVDKNNNIVGIEVFDFAEGLETSDKELQRILSACNILGERNSSGEDNSSWEEAEEA